MNAFGEFFQCDYTLNALQCACSTNKDFKYEVAILQWLENSFIFLGTVALFKGKTKKFQQIFIDHQKQTESNI